MLINNYKHKQTRRKKKKPGKQTEHKTNKDGRHKPVIMIKTNLTFPPTAQAATTSVHVSKFFGVYLKQS